MVWVNKPLVAASIVGDTSVAISLLDPAKDFMTFDTTIERIVITDLTFTFLKTVATGVVTARFALQIAPTTMDTDDFESLFLDSIGPPWMYTSGVTGNVNNGVSATFTFDSSRLLKAKRRFRENDSTLFLIFSNIVDGGFYSGGQLDGMIRTLIRIP